MAASVLNTMLVMGNSGAQALFEVTNYTFNGAYSMSYSSVRVKLVIVALLNRDRNI